jgi:hypothetical protein
MELQLGKGPPIYSKGGWVKTLATVREKPNFLLPLNKFWPSFQSLLIPFFKGFDLQQLENKRHLTNGACMISD